MKKVSIGDRVLRTETKRYVRGEGCYVDDRQLPGMCHVAFLRSSFPHARVLSINTEGARTLPGVRLVVTGADIASSIVPIQNKLPIVTDRVRFVGEIVAAVVAEDRYIAEDALELLEVSYEELSGVSDPNEAMKPGAPQLFEGVENNCVYERRFATPGCDEAFASAPVVVEVNTRSARAAAAPMEPRSYAAQWNEGSQTVTLWTCSANPFGVSKDVALSLGLPETHVRVQVVDVGGSFGSKNAIYPEEIMVAWLAKAVNVPVKFTETRSEHLHATHQGRDQRHKVRGAFSSDGRILALEDFLVADMGATAHADNSIYAAANYVPGPYKVPEYRLWSLGACTNKPPHGSLRGIGKADAAFAIERLMDQAARELKIDRAELRLRNLIPEEEFPYRTVTGALLDCGRYHATLRKAMELAGYEELIASQAELRQRGIYRGVGVSFVIEPTSASRGFTGMGGGMGFAGCRVTITPTGAVLVQSGTAQQGQGHQTTLAQIVADRLDVTMESITVVLSDTHSTPHGFQTASSRSTTTLMSAAYRAADMVGEKLRAIAAYRWNIPAADVVLRDSGAEGPDGQRLSIAEIAFIAYVRIDQLPPDMDPGLELLGTFRNPNINFEPDEQGRFNSFASYPYDACVVAVDVDIDTGMLAIRKYVSVHDCGNAINPNVVETQHTGATVQGLGLALLEEITFDSEGHPFTSGFMDYLLPTVNELPDEFITDHMVTPTPFTPHGGKGAGETGTLSPPVALASAIEDAIGLPGPHITEMPFSPERVFAVIQKMKEA